MSDRLSKIITIWIIVVLMVMLVLGLISCVQRPGDSSWKVDENTVRIDGCQYLTTGSPGSTSYTICHKGNCDNPIHIYNKISPKRE